MTNRPWLTKSANKQGSTREASAPGKCILVDHMESSIPVFIAQLKGKPTKQSYRAATIFLDHYSELTYVHLQIVLSSEETVEAKRTFEAFTQTYKIKIRHYHAENGRFSDNALVKEFTQESQTISYCGVNSRFRNGKSEKRIRDIQEKTRERLHNAKARWPSAVEPALWPYALRQENNLRNCLLDKEDSPSPLDRFSKISVSPKIRENHSFGCPLFALQNRPTGRRGGVPK